MAYDSYDEPVAETREDSSGKDSKTGLLPKSFFGDNRHFVNRINLKAWSGNNANDIGVHTFGSLGIICLTALWTFLEFAGIVNELHLIDLSCY